VLWLLRTGALTKKGLMDADAHAVSACAHIPGLARGQYCITACDTRSGDIVKRFELFHANDAYLCLPLPSIKTDLALAVQRIAD
jgi:hypothetical protein